jgi:hypothetical protein
VVVHGFVNGLLIYVARLPTRPRRIPNSRRTSSASSSTSHAEGGMQAIFYPAHRRGRECAQILLNLVHPQGFDVVTGRPACNQQRSPQTGAPWQPTSHPGRLPCPAPHHGQNWAIRSRSSNTGNEYVRALDHAMGWCVGPGQPVHCSALLCGRWKPSGTRRDRQESTKPWPTPR